MLHNVLVTRIRNNFLQCVLCTNFLPLYFMIVFIVLEKTQVGPSSGKLETKNTSFFVLGSCRSCVLYNLLVALSRYKLSLCILRDGCDCTHFVALYWLMVFINEKHVMPSSGQVETKRHLLSYLVLAGSEWCPLCQLIQRGTNYHITYIGWYRLHPSSGIILIDGVYSWNTCDAI